MDVFSSSPKDMQFHQEHTNSLNLQLNGKKETLQIWGQSFSADVGGVFLTPPPTATRKVHFIIHGEKTSWREKPSFSVSLHDSFCQSSWDRNHTALSNSCLNTETLITTEHHDNNKKTLLLIHHTVWPRTHHQLSAVFIPQVLVSFTFQTWLYTEILCLTLLEYL